MRPAQTQPGVRAPAQVWTVGRGSLPHAFALLEAAQWAQLGLPGQPL